MVDEKVKSSVIKYLKTLRKDGYPDAQGVIFGSFAVGKPHKWSDIDLIVLSAKFDAGIDLSDRQKLWLTAANVDSRIEPIGCGLRQWEEDDGTPIIDLARRDGVLAEG